VVQQATRIILETKGIKHVNAYAGFSILSGSSQSNVATLFARLDDFDKRAGHADLHANAVIKNLQQRLAQVDDGPYRRVCATAYPGHEFGGRVQAANPGSNQCRY